MPFDSASFPGDLRGVEAVATIQSGSISLNYLHIPVISFDANTYGISIPCLSRTLPPPCVQCTT